MKNLLLILFILCSTAACAQFKVMNDGGNTYLQIMYKGRWIKSTDTEHYQLTQGGVSYWRVDSNYTDEISHTHAKMVPMVQDAVKVDTVTGPGHTQTLGVYAYDRIAVLRQNRWLNTNKPYKFLPYAEMQQ